MQSSDHQTANSQQGLGPQLFRVFHEPSSPYQRGQGIRGRKCILIHADDFGMSGPVNQATICGLEDNILSSASVMVPCPGFHEAATYIGRHPEYDIGIHLTLTSEWDGYRWGPVAPRQKVPSLLAPDGNFWQDPKMVAEKGRLDEVEIEVTCQIEQALSAGIRPTHLDTHMFTLLMSVGLYAVYVKVARRFGLPFLALGPALRKERLVNSTFITAEKTPPEQWMAAYVQTLQELEDDVTQLLVHVGFDGPELRAITGTNRPFGSEWRQRDFDVLSSVEFRAALESTGAMPVGWKDLVCPSESKATADTQNRHRFS